jgi:serine/threonine protein phosphatase PrpC
MSKIYSAYEYSWVGSTENYVDTINIHKINHIVLGRFGGNSSAGQYKNEDGCIVWVDEKGDWEFVVLLDAHQTAESADLAISTFEALKDDIKILLQHSVKESFDGLSKLVLTTFQSEGFKGACKNIQGETACLFVVRKGKFLWWLSVGDCILYLFHPELAALNEYQQNQRSFYQWVGQVHTFDLPVPCYSEGRKELRKGNNHIFLTTDGLTECPNTSFENPKVILKPFETRSNEESVWQLLNEIKNKDVRDSTTILSWYVHIDSAATQPSDI